LNRSSFAFFVALLIHLLIVLLLWVAVTYSPQVERPQEIKEKKIKISLKELPKKKKKMGDTKQKVKPTPIAPPMPKGSQLKKIVKEPLVTKPPVKYKPKVKPKKPKLNPRPKPKKPKVKPKIEPLPPTKPYIPLIKKEEPKKVKKEPKIKKDPMAWMYEDKSAQEDKTKKVEKSEFGVGGTTKQMKKLYGNEWGKLTEGQKRYMLDNQEIMRRITQQVLTRVARVNLKRNLNVNVTNIIEFKLHPNGDMSDFKFLKNSGHYVLDDTTKETIEYAYSRYPRPREVILIRYNVYYNLARY